MGIQELDKEVLKAIQTLNTLWEKVSIRKIAKIINKLSSLRSIQLSIERLLKEWLIRKNSEWNIENQTNSHFFHEKTRWIPLLWTIACWWPILAEENIESYVPIWIDIVKEVYDYFLLRTTWDSMDLKWINEWDVVLIREQNTANNGDIVVALVDDSATLKEIQIVDWIVKLIPHSSNKIHKTIIVTENLIIQGVLEKNLGEI